jgi:hypothetical protein
VEAAPVLFTLETLIITVSAGAVAALVLGFVSGKTRKQRSGSAYPYLWLTDPDPAFFVSDRQENNFFYFFLLITF